MISQCILLRTLLKAFQKLRSQYIHRLFPAPFNLADSEKRPIDHAGPNAGSDNLPHWYTIGTGNSDLKPRPQRRIFLLFHGSAVERMTMETLLESIHSPADLKRMSIAQMTELAAEIREFLIQTLSKTGGHLGPNLGVVELTLALHTVFNTPEDKLLFDVSHQAYIHKILTGRLERFETIRQPGGLNGFMLRTESEHDCYGAGHAGTALSAALGMAVARARRYGYRCNQAATLEIRCAD